MLKNHKPKHVAACAIQIVYTAQSYFFSLYACTGTQRGDLVKRRIVLIPPPKKKASSCLPISFINEQTNVIFPKFQQKKSCAPVTRYDVRYALINFLYRMNISTSLEPTCRPMFGQPYIILPLSGSACGLPLA
jgi:hypothetical protein